jgi:hypothetical protein
MNESPASLGLQAVGLERRLSLAFGFYVVALFSIVGILAGSVVVALFMIVVGEMLFSFWRPTPRLGQANYNTPAGPAWQTPITLIRWYVVIRTAGGLAFGAVIVTVFMGFFIFVAMKPTGFGPANYTVLALMVAWLASRWFWAPPLMRWIGRSMSGVGKPGVAPIQVGVDGLNILPAQNAGGGQVPVIQLGYGEIDEMRMLSWLDATAYWQSVAQYDPTLPARASWELVRFLQGQAPRPSILMYDGQGMNLLIRGPQVLYLMGWADQTGPSAIASWQAWRASHAQQAAPTA